MQHILKPPVRPGRESGSGFLRRLGLHGYDDLDPLILAALVTRDPVLLIGSAGTGKTMMLNRLSAALGLEQRHYNASLLSFDDLVGFPYPDRDHECIRYLPTPSTAWEAESVLIDEINRCRPEVQNKFFSIIHERRLQGISLDRLVYRWAAMNPVKGTAHGTNSLNDTYDGVYTLDQSLADRFALLIRVPDFRDLNDNDQLLLAMEEEGEADQCPDPGLAADLKILIGRTAERFAAMNSEEDPGILYYVQSVARSLTDAGVRISPRRVYLMARNIRAVRAAGEVLFPDQTEEMQANLIRTAFICSLPHHAWCPDAITAELVDTVHTEAMNLFNASRSGESLYLYHMANCKCPVEAFELLHTGGLDTETRGLGLLQWWGRADEIHRAVFAFSAWPYLTASSLVNHEEMQAIQRKAGTTFHVTGNLRWREREGDKHPVWSKCLAYMMSSGIDRKRKARARQLFTLLISKDVNIPSPSETEQLLNRMFTAARERHLMLMEKIYNERREACKI